MNRRFLRLIIMGSAVLFFVVAIFVFISYQRRSISLPKAVIPSGEKAESDRNLLDMQVNCFFFSEGSTLMRAVSKRLQCENRKNTIFNGFLSLLLAGEEGFIVPIPAGTKIRGLFYLPLEKRLILDFEEGLGETMLSGSSAELAFIYFFVNNLCFNFKEIESVQFLVSGNERETLAGHITFDEPFFPDYSYMSGVNEQ